MKKAIFRANIIIVAMLMCLIGIGFHGYKSQKVQADSRVIYSGNQQNNNVCFMINVYQGEDYVKAILDICDVYRIKTTFFVGGCWASKNIELVKEMYSRGHEIANHGFNHRDHDKLDYSQNEQEIMTCHKLISKNIGVEMTLFAPPSGAFNTTTIDVASSLGYKTIMWTRDTIDWRDQDATLIFNRATKNLKNGDLVLMHPTKKTVEAFTDIVSTAINNGFNPTTVSHCLE